MNTITVDWLFIIMIFNDETTSADISTQISIEVEKNLIVESIENAHYNINKTAIVLVETKRLSTDNIHFKTTFKTKKNTPGKLEDLAPEIISEDAMLTKESLKVILETITRVYNCKNNIILSLGHGSVFGINYTWVKPINDALRNLIAGNKDASPKWVDKISKELINKVKAANSIDIANETILQPTFNSPDYLYKPLNEKENIFYMLSPYEMKEVFMEVFTAKEKPVDIFAFSNCFMQNIFTQYDLYRAVDFLVAPISGISYPGYNIAAILPYLDSATSVKDVARYFVNSEAIRANKRYNESAAKEAIENRWFIQCIQLDTVTFGGFKDAFKNFLDTVYIILQSDDEHKKIIKKFFDNLIFDLYKYSKKSSKSTELIDFKVYCMALKRNIKSLYTGDLMLQKIIPCLETIIKLLDSISIDYFVGDNFLNDVSSFTDYEMYGSEVKKRIAFGVYFPREFTSKTNLLNMLSKDNRFRPALLYNTRYEDILRALS